MFGMYFLGLIVTSIAIGLNTSASIGFAVIGAGLMLYSILYSVFKYLVSRNKCKG